MRGAADAAPADPECPAKIADLRTFVNAIVAEGTPEIPMPALVTLERPAVKPVPERAPYLEINPDRLAELAPATMRADGPLPRVRLVAR